MRRQYSTERPLRRPPPAFSDGGDSDVQCDDHGEDGHGSFINARSERIARNAEEGSGARNVPFGLHQCREDVFAHDVVQRAGADGGGGCR